MRPARLRSAPSGKLRQGPKLGSPGKGKLCLLSPALTIRQRRSPRALEVACIGEEGEKLKLEITKLWGFVRACPFESLEPPPVGQRLFALDGAARKGAPAGGRSRAAKSLPCVPLGITMWDMQPKMFYLERKARQKWPAIIFGGYDGAYPTSFLLCPLR